ncbi:hypothetical protein K2173_018067 [Erythroxylum novogranatense]|uniref:Uncharacterized protein n=1 Tax=Erythroxylum novogranatense TaxID=1862640 RepID=A0AAV8TUD8_9ROSI|nr:hypothetical protein K2173_018067 [Erythroxylum novogranatense]
MCRCCKKRKTINSSKKAKSQSFLGRVICSLFQLLFLQNTEARIGYKRQLSCRQNMLWEEYVPKSFIEHKELLKHVLQICAAKKTSD